MALGVWMKEIIPGLFVGSQEDYEYMDPKGWYIVHACKEPYHRQLLGYTTQAAPKDSPEYLWARRENVLYMNLVDPRDAKWIPQPLVDKALRFIEEGIDKGANVLVHCNMGNSRAPSLALLYLIKSGNVATLTDALNKMQWKYGTYVPSKGWKEYIDLHWMDYSRLH